MDVTGMLIERATKDAVEVIPDDVGSDIFGILNNHKAP